MKEISISQFGTIGDGVTDDTNHIQEAVVYCSKHKLKLKFEKKTYLCNTITILKNTTIDFNGANIKCIGHHFMHNFWGVEKYRKYKGNGNITIKNLNVIGGHVASFIHGKNILFDNIKAQEPECDHYFEICACKNVTIKNSSFYGVTKKSSERNMVEMIQIDNCDKYAFPWFKDKESVTYDDTTNKNIIIENCKFDKAEDEKFKYIYTAIGVHTKNKKYHKNIIIKNCIINNATYASIHGMSWKRVYILSNQFNNCSKYIFENCKHVIIK